MPPKNTNKTTIKDGKRIFTKSWTDKKGNIRHAEYHMPEKTINEELSEDLKKTKKEWTKEATEVLTKNFEDKLKSKMGSYARYFAQISKKSTQRVDDRLYARKGGYIVAVEKDYMRLKNAKSGIIWSVQYKNLDRVFLLDKKEPTPEEAAAAKAEREQEKKNRKKISKSKKLEEAKEKAEAKAQAKAEKEAARAEAKAKKEASKPKKFKLPLEEAEEALEQYYYNGHNHFGRDGLFKSINIYLNDQNETEGKTYIPRKVVETWLKKQELYQLTKPSKKQKDFQVVNAKAPYNVMQMDLVEMGPKPTIVLNIIDAFSRYAWSAVLPNKTAGKVIAGLKKISKTAHFKWPGLIVSDNGPEFVNKKMTEFLDKHSVKHITTLPHNPQANGKVERLNGTFKSLYDKMEKLEGTGPLNSKVVKEINEVYNNSYHRIIKTIPAKALLKENQESVGKATSKAKQPQSLDNIEKGDVVRIATKHQDKDAAKHRPNWSEALFRITQVRVSKKNPSKPVLYRVEYVDTEKRAAADKRKEANRRAGRKHADDTEGRGSFTRQELQLIAEKEQVEKDGLEEYTQGNVNVKYVVDRVVKVAVAGAGDNITMKWKGFRSTGENNTTKSKGDWEKELGKEGLKELLDEFRQKK